MSSGESRRGLWGSKLGFVLAASGSAIGLGNIVFFGANAYRYGGGAFYVPYFVALFLLGIPMMIVEFGLGKTQRRSFPASMRKACGAGGEFFGWWSQINALFIGMYYITILSWAASMLMKAFGPLLEDGRASVGPTFGATLASWTPAAFVVVLWGLNMVFLSKGTKTIERTAKIFVPLMWVFMIVLVVRGLSLDNGFQGVWYLFTPNFDGILDFSVWRGAFSQMFFSLSLGLGTMVAYSSYLPKKSDVITNAGMVSFLNCSFEFIAGVAIFSILFAFSLYPGSSTGTLGMSLVVIPSGIAEFPAAQAVFAGLFFFLLVIAGLTSSISILEAPISAIRDKFAWPRGKVLALIALIGLPGSLVFALPMMLDRGGEPTQTTGLTLLDLLDHWAFGYSLLIVGLTEALYIGWGYGISRLRNELNATSFLKLGPWFDWLIKLVIPVVISVVLIFNVLGEIGAFYGTKESQLFDGLNWLPFAVFIFWAIATFGGASVLTRLTQAKEEGIERVES